jgi:hypothetical protein
MIPNSSPGTAPSVAPDLVAAWTAALRAAIAAIHAADPTDLRPLQRGVELACHAAAAAESIDLRDAMRWVAVTEQVIAVADDLAAIPDPDAASSVIEGQSPGFPAAPMPNTVAVRDALRDLWESIHGGLRRYATSEADGIRAYCAEITAWSAMRMIEAGAAR